VFSDEIQDIYNLENVAIIDKAEEADAPYNINYVKDNVIYLMIGVVLSFGVVFVMYYFDTTIKSSETVEEKLGLTVIGIVPKESKE
jgi:capsular polysaccharide biosynthesis protein